jgi:4,5-DOPA dioxygenase extradiol
MNSFRALEQTLKPSPRMPVLFVGHGNPMNAILDNSFTRKWQSVGATLPAAQAIVVISAHWLTRGTRITDAPKQPIIYDMYGFPDELYRVKYPADGSPELAELLRQKLLKYEAALDSSWGLDHGTWSVLKHLKPEPKVPVLQISLDVNKSLDQVVELFKTLQPLREKGVLFIGSGNIVHNLRAVDFSASRKYDWAEEFDDFSKSAITNHRIKDLTNPHKQTNAAYMAVPTDDHYRPMLAAMALLRKDEQVTFFNETIDLASVGMRSFITNGK